MINSLAPKPPIPLEQALEQGMPNVIRGLLDRQREEELGPIEASLAVMPFLDQRRDRQLDLRRGMGVEMLLGHGMPAPGFSEFVRDEAGRIAGVRPKKHTPDRVRNGEREWPFLPVLGGHWDALDADDTWSLLLDCVEQEQLSLYDLERYRPSSARRLALNFYSQGALYEILVRPQQRTTPGTLVVVRSGEQLAQLTGESSAIHRFNEAGPLRLPGVMEAAHYLKFYCALIQSPDGNFRVLDSPDYVHWDGQASAGAVAGLCGEPKALALAPVDGAFRFSCNVLHARSIFAVTLAVNPTGEVEMLDDAVLVDGLTVRHERFVDGVREFGKP